MFIREVVIMSQKNITHWDVLMKLEEAQRSAAQLNTCSMDLTCLYDQLKHSVLDYADNKPEGKDLYCHNDQLVKETDGYVEAIDEAMQNLKECKNLVNAFLEENN